MTELVLIPDAEQLIINLLYHHPALDDDGVYVSSKLPESFEAPWVRVTQLDASRHPDIPVDYLITYLMQFDCYAGEGTDNPQAQANRISRVVRAILDTQPNTLVPGATITNVAFSSHIHLPDETLGWRERYVLDASISMHWRDD